MLRFILVACISFAGFPPQDKTTAITGITLIDGTGAAAVKNATIVIEADTIAGVFTDTKKIPAGTTVIDLKGKTIMPSLINAHGHLGMTKGTTTNPANYSRDNILRQLIHYEAFGISAVLSMGTDQDIIFGLRDSSKRGLLPGAIIFSAAYGINAVSGGPSGPKIFRPQTTEEAINVVRQLAPIKPDIIKIWVDDFRGTSAKMKQEVYEAVIKEAHANGLRVAAHVFYLDDARKLVAAGIDAFAHSIRDADIDDQLLKEMKAKNVTYIPTLTLDEYNFIYAQQPAWMNDPFFKASLESGFIDTLKSEAYINRIKNDPDLQKKTDAFQTALRNLQKIFKAGITVAMGTDSGAQPVRAQGFSEHLELQLMVQAGMTPLEAITCATKNGAQFLHIENSCGTLEPGKKANFIVLNNDPLTDIKFTTSIASVWQNGIKVNDGPLGRQ